MEPETKDGDFKKFQLDSAARQFADDTNEEEKDDDMQMSLNSLVPSIDSLTINGEYIDYFPILALPSHLLDLVFSSLPPKDRSALAGVNTILNMIESESKYFVESLAVAEVPPIPAPLPPIPQKMFKIYGHSIVLFENKSYSSDFLRRIAHNASIGKLYIKLSGTSEFHREVYNLVKEMDFGKLSLYFKDKPLAREMMTGSFVLDLTRCCKELYINLHYVTPENIHELYKILIDGLAKIRGFHSNIAPLRSLEFFRLIGVTYRDETFFSNRTDIEVYKDYKAHYLFDGFLEMVLGRHPNIGTGRLEFHLIRHETQESLVEAKKKKGMEKIEIVPDE